MGLTLIAKAQAQTKTKDKIFLSIEGMAGNTWAHHQSINYLLQYPPTGMNLKAGIRSNGKQLWEEDLNYPRYGLGYQYARLGSNILGNAHAIYLFLESDFWNHKKIRWTYDIGAGVGLIDNPYDAQKNPLNIVNGSVANAFLRVSTGINYGIAPKHDIKINGGLFHLSNGNIALPNWGSNILFMSVGWQYQFTDTLKYTNPEKDRGRQKSKRVTIYGGAGYKEERPVDRKKYMVSDIHCNFWRQYRPAHSWGAGFSVFYDQASKKMLWRGKQENQIALKDYQIKKYEYWSLGAQLGYMLNLHPVYFSFEFGIYLYSEVKRDIFNRWLLEIQLTNKVRFYGGLKARFGKADFTEFGLAYDIFTNNK